MYTETTKYGVIFTLTSMYTALTSLIVMLPVYNKMFTAYKPVPYIQLTLKLQIQTILIIARCVS